MKILLEECVPKPIKSNLSVNGHKCSTVPETGLAGKTNGELIALAETDFEVFVTLDKGMQFQQNLSGSQLAIIVIRCKSSRIADILPHIPECLGALRSIQPGQVIQIGEKAAETDN